MTLGGRFKEHTNSKHLNSAVTEHTSTTGHRYRLANVKVLVKEESDFKKKAIDAVAIHRNKPGVNRDRGHEISAILF